MSGTINANTQGFTVLVQQQAAAAQVAANANVPGTVLNFTPGSVLLAIFQAVAGVALWLQGLVLNLLLVSRVTTSTGSDVDSWMAQFQFSRISATAATCATVALSRYSSSAAVVIPPGGAVQTADGTQRFTIVADATQAGYSVAAGGYVMAVGTSSVQVTVQAVNTGAGGNVAAGTITAFASGIVGADTVTNTGAAVGGSNAESDNAFRARFWNYLKYLWRATPDAIIYAVQSIQVGITATVVENQTPSGAYQPGYFFVTVDDGTGAPSAATLAAAGSAVETVRGASTTYGVFGPAVVSVNLAVTVSAAAGVSTGTVIANVQTAAISFVNSTVLAQNLSYWKTGTAIENAQGVDELISLTINGATADVPATATQKIVCGAVTVTVV